MVPIRAGADIACRPGLHHLPGECASERDAGGASLLGSAHCGVLDHGVCLVHLRVQVGE